MSATSAQVPERASSKARSIVCFTLGLGRCSVDGSSPNLELFGNGGRAYPLSLKVTNGRNVRRRLAPTIYTRRLGLLNALALALLAQLGSASGHALQVEAVTQFSQVVGAVPELETPGRPRLRTWSRAGCKRRRRRFYQVIGRQLSRRMKPRC